MNTSDLILYLILAVTAILIVLPMWWEDHEACKCDARKSCHVCGGQAELTSPKGTPICLHCYSLVKEFLDNE